MFTLKSGCILHVQVLAGFVLSLNALTISGRTLRPVSQRYRKGSAASTSKPISVRMGGGSRPFADTHPLIRPHHVSSNSATWTLTASITASHHLHRASSLRELSKSCRQMLPFNIRSEGRVRLPNSEFGQATDQFAEWDISPTKHSRTRKQRRFWTILSAVAFCLLVVVIYGVNVHRSWAAWEENWRVSPPSRVYHRMLKLVDEHIECTGDHTDQH